MVLAGPANGSDRFGVAQAAVFAPRIEVDSAVRHDTVYLTVKRVKTSAGGTGGGTSWADAYGDLQDGLNDAVGGDEIWVAEGTYYPTFDYGLGIGDRGKHFKMKNGVKIYGGFPDAGDPGMTDRDPNMYETILSGDLNGNDGPNFANNSDNCYHVFYHSEGLSLGSNAILDGFTITAGNTNDSEWIHVEGGGMYNNNNNSPTVINCTFTGNSAHYGSGMYNHTCNNTTVTGCILIDNMANSSGGGMYNRFSSPTVSGCAFIGNRAGYGGGGGMFNRESSPTVTGCTFAGNTADYGGGIYNFDNSNPTVTGCTFIGNSSGSA